VTRGRGLARIPKTAADKEHQLGPMTNPGSLLVSRISRRQAVAGGLATVIAAIQIEGFMNAAEGAILSDVETQARGFDFLLGDWIVHHRKLKQRLQGSTDWIEFPGTLSVQRLPGIGNVDENVLEDPNGSYLATSLRIFNPKANHWSIYWIDGRDPAITTPVVGRFEGRKGTFFSNDDFNGKPVRVRFTYEDVATGHGQWTQAFSPDAGHTWELNWVMDFLKRPGATERA
jgi:hypothetical protein